MFLSLVLIEYTPIVCSNTPYFSYTDLVILDIKALEPFKYKEITGKTINQFNYFKDKLKEHKTKLWIRQVIIPGINDNMEYINSLKEYIEEFDNVENIDLLAYHTMGISKYEKLRNMDWTLQSPLNLSLS